MESRGANLIIQWEELFNLGKPVESKGECGGKPDLALEVAIGNKEVEKYFRKMQREGERDSPVHYIKAVELLKLNVIVPPDFLQILKKKHFR